MTRNGRPGISGLARKMSSWSLSKQAIFITTVNKLQQDLKGGALWAAVSFELMLHGFPWVNRPC
jgi:hypothetical protein